MEQVRMAQIGSTAARHIPHQILHQHCGTRLFVRGSCHLSPDGGDAMVSGHSTDHTEMKELELGKGGLGGTDYLTGVGGSSGSDSLGSGIHGCGDNSRNVNCNWWR